MITTSIISFILGGIVGMAGMCILFAGRDDEG